MFAAQVLDQFPPELRKPVTDLYVWIRNDVEIFRKDFDRLGTLLGELGEIQKRTEIKIGELTEAQTRTEIKIEELAEAQKRTEVRLETLSGKVEELAEAQKRTEVRLETLSGKVEELAEAQKRTEVRLETLSGKVEELAEAQKRTEVKVEELAEAQKRTEVRLETLSGKVEELAEAQKRTEVKVEELAEAQKKTEIRMEKGFQDLKDSIAALGSRWGIMSEETFRSTIKGILEKTGYTVDRGFFGGREIDLVIRNGEHILLEITSSFRKSDIAKILSSAEDYQLQTNICPILMVAAIYIHPAVMRELIEAPRRIELFTYAPS